MVGKNTHLVPVIYPLDTLRSLEILADPIVRKNAGVEETNPYLFPSTRNSEFHLSGWHGFDDICKRVQLKEPINITFTKNRHLISSMYSLMELPEHERTNFYDHLGHSESMNKNRYQCPPALKELTRVGKVLHTIDEIEFAIDETSKLPNSPSTFARPSTSASSSTLTRPLASSGPSDVADLSSSLLTSPASPLESLETKRNTPMRKKFKLKNVQVMVEENTPVKEYKLRKRSFVFKESSDESSDTESSVDEGSDYKQDSQSEDDDMELDSETRALENLGKNKNYKTPKKNKIGKPDTDRSYHLWTPKSSSNLFDEFGDFISGVEKDWPSRGTMEEFLAKCDNKMPLYTLRTKLNNERKKYRARLGQRKEEMKLLEDCDN